MDFCLSKKNALSKFDKSHEGSWDSLVVSFCSLVNEHENFFTCSSCSGRIVVVPSGEVKVPDAFLLKSHALIDVSVLESLVFSGVVSFRLDPCAFHIVCKNFFDAQKLVSLARSAGFSKSGIISSKGRFVCELFSSEILVVPLVNGLPREYLEVLVSEANRKLRSTHDKILRLERVFRDELFV